jgi:hypothetical protein
MSYHAQGNSIYTQFNHTGRILSEILSLSIYTYKQYRELTYNNIRQLTYLHSDDIRGCIDTIRPPEDEQRTARNM